jgi:hypothetical protein
MSAQAPVSSEPASTEENHIVVNLYFETSATQYAWLQQVVTISIRIGIPSGVSYRIFAIR